MLLLGLVVSVGVVALVLRLVNSTADEVLSDVDLKGKHILVTGATAGIGWETARALAAKGAIVHVGGRSVGSTNSAIHRIHDQHPAATLHPFVADLSDLAQVEQATAAVDGPLDVVIANAGLVPGTFEVSAQGIEQTFAVSHLAHALLIDRLLPNLRAAAKSNGEARVVLVSSESHRARKSLRLDEVPMTAETFGGLKAYELSKVCNVLHAVALDSRQAERGVRAFSLHPGNLIRTNISRSNGLVKVATWLYAPFAPTIEQGAATSVYAAVHPDLTGSGGSYLKGCRVRNANALGRDRSAAEELWSHTKTLLSKAGFPMVNA